jgi:hypothetical protein
MKPVYFILALSFLLWGSGPSTAQTLSYTAAIEQMVAACGADLRRYCKDVPLGNGRIRACFNAHQASLSPNCQRTRTRVYASIARRVAAQKNIVRICNADIKRLCQGVVPGDANILNCMLEAKPSFIRPECRQTLADTGWRSEKVQQ